MKNLIAQILETTEHLNKIVAERIPADDLFDRLLENEAYLIRLLGVAKSDATQNLGKNGLANLKAAINATSDSVCRSQKWGDLYDASFIVHLGLLCEAFTLFNDAQND